MSLTFYHSPMSTACITTLVLEELGIPCERVFVDLRAGETRSAEFLKLNPNGKVPVIVHDGTVIWESAAITMYLGETFGVERNLYPAPGPARGEAMRWIVWANVTLAEAVGRYVRSTTTWVPADQHNANAAKAALADVHEALSVLDRGLIGRDFLLGSFSLVDAHLKSLTDWLRHMAIDFTAYERLNAWAQRCADRPAFARAEAREGSPH